MKPSPRLLWFLIFLMVGVATVGAIWRSRPAVASEDRGDGKGHVEWSTDFEAARKQANAENKPMLIVFTASWCPPCRMMKESTWIDSSVANAVTQKFIPVMIDVDANRDLATQFQVQSIPRLDVLTPSGGRKTVSVGYRGPSSMVSLLK